HGVRGAGVAGLELRPVVLVGVRSLVAAAAASVVALALNGGLGPTGVADAGTIALAMRIAVVSAVGFGVYALLALALRIPELPSIVGVMADLLRRPRRA